jgi:hypothetical protein
VLLRVGVGASDFDTDHEVINYLSYEIDCSHYGIGLTAAKQCKPLVEIRIDGVEVRANEGRYAVR